MHICLWSIQPLKNGIQEVSGSIPLNIKTATTGGGVVYRFEYDAYGNNTQISIVNGDKGIATKARYSEDGNGLEYVLDTQDYKTKNCYHENTNVLEWVEYPNDTESTRTEYTYDEMVRLATAAADVSTCYTLTASYTYADDLLTQIETGFTTYSFYLRRFCPAHL